VTDEKVTDEKARSKPILIAHRGYSECYPENTLAGLQAALNTGAQCIEFDVHLSADEVPVVFHDSDVKRVTGSEGTIQEMTYSALKMLRASEPDRFAEKYSQEPVPSLEAVLALLKQWPNATAFVEIKTDTLKHFGVTHVVKIIMAALAEHQKHCVLISFDRTVLDHARKAGMLRIGWVVREWNAQAQTYAQALSPDFLFCNAEKIGKEDALWPGPWQWALYDIVDPDVALQWYNRGVELIETWDIGGMLADPRLAVEDVDDS